MSITLELKDLSFRYHKDTDLLFDHLSLQLDAGNITAITGSNGSGKTSLLYAICGIIPKVIPGILTGQVLISDKSISTYTLPQVSQWMNILLQDPDHQLVFPIVEQELAFGAENLCVPASEIEERISKSLSRLHLEELRFAHTSELSYGQKKLVAFASLLVMNSPILLLDEPSAGLDESSRNLLKKTLLELSTQGKIILFADHTPDILSIATRQIVMPFTGTEPGI